MQYRERRGRYQLAGAPRSENEGSGERTKEHSSECRVGSPTVAEDNRYFRNSDYQEGRPLAPGTVYSGLQLTLSSVTALNWGSHVDTNSPLTVIYQVNEQACCSPEEEELCELLPQAPCTAGL